MSINDFEDSPPPPRQVLRGSTHQEAQQSLSKVPSGASALKRRICQRCSTYSIPRRDVLDQAIDEFQLLGSVDSYSELLTRLGFDLTPLDSDGVTWYLCRGKGLNGRPCRRMIPEVYLKVTIGHLLIAAEDWELKGDDLVEELADAFSYTICSEHNQTIHRVVCALDSRSTVEQWREGSIETATAMRMVPIWREPPASLSSLLRDRSNGSSPELLVNEPFDSPPSPSPVRFVQANEREYSLDAWDDDSDDDILADFVETEKHRVERHYQEYLRGSSQGRRPSQDSNSSVSSMGQTFKGWKVLGKWGAYS